MGGGRRLPGPGRVLADGHPARRRAVAAGRGAAPARPAAVPRRTTTPAAGWRSSTTGTTRPARPAEGYRLFAEACAELRRRFRLHPLEVPDVLAAATRESDELPRPDRFGGFCTDTFAFLAELADHNGRGVDGRPAATATSSPSAGRSSSCAGPWPRATSSRCCNRQLGWDLETEAKAGRALSSVVQERLRPRRCRTSRPCG